MSRNSFGRLGRCLIQMCRKRFTIFDVIVAVTSFALASAAFSGLCYYAINYEKLRPGRRAPRTLWPSDAPFIESTLLIVLFAILIFLPLYAIVRNPCDSMFRINRRYYLTWIIGFVFYIIWAAVRSTPH